MILLIILLSDFVKTGPTEFCLEQPGGRPVWRPKSAQKSGGLAVLV